MLGYLSQQRGGSLGGASGTLRLGTALWCKSPSWTESHDVTYDGGPETVQHRFHAGNISSNATFSIFWRVITEKQQQQAVNIYCSTYSLMIKLSAIYLYFYGSLIKSPLILSVTLLDSYIYCLVCLTKV